MIYSPLLEMLIDDYLFYKWRKIDEIEEIDLCANSYFLGKINNCSSLADFSMLNYESPTFITDSVIPYKRSSSKNNLRSLFKCILFKENFIEDINGSLKEKCENEDKRLMRILLDMKINRIIEETLEFYSLCSNEEQIIHKITRNETKYLFFWINHFSSEKYYNKEIATKLVEFALKVYDTTDEYNSIAISVGLHLQDKILSKEIFEKSLSKVTCPGEFIHIKNCMNIVFGNWVEITEEWIRKSKDKENLYNLTRAIARQNDTSAKELARKYFPLIIKESDDAVKLVNIGNAIGSYYWDGLGDVEWSKTVYQLALNKAKDNIEIVWIIETMVDLKFLDKEFLEEVKQLDKDDKLIKDDILKKVDNILNKKI